LEQEGNGGENYPWCQCREILSVTEKCLHPLLRSVIRSYLTAVQPTVREAEGDFITLVEPLSVLSTHEERTKLKNDERDDEDVHFSNENLIDDTLVYQEKRSYVSNVDELSLREEPSYDADAEDTVSRLSDDDSAAANDLASKTSPANANDYYLPDRDIKNDKNATLCLTLHLSHLCHPSKGSNGTSSVHSRQKQPVLQDLPNPFVEVFVAHRAGLSMGYYKSYPLHRSNRATWEDCFVDTGLSHDQLVCGIAAGSRVEVGIRVMHCPSRGSTMKLIGTCVVSLDALERAVKLRREHFEEDYGEEYRSLDDENSSTVIPSRPAMYPILQGYQVMGWLEVLSLYIK